MLTIYSMSAGGAERTMAWLANEWSAEGHRVCLATWDDGSSPAFFPLDPSVVRRPLGIAGRPHGALRLLRKFFRRVMTIRHAVRAERPDVLLSFADRVNITTVLATLGLGVPIVVSERTDPRHYPAERLWRTLRRVAYSFADRIVVQTEEARRYFHGWTRAKTDAIPNPVFPVRTIGEKADLPRPHLLFVGRLHAYKGVDTLLRAFSLLPRAFNDWSLVLVGDGPERAALEKLASDLKIADRVRFVGEVADAGPFYEQTDLFVLPSHFEGFPNALREAMAHGRPVVATAAAGPRVIVREGVDGLLVPPRNVEALAGALESLLADPERRAAWGRRAKEITERFPPAAIFSRWNQVIGEVVKCF